MSKERAQIAGIHLERGVRSTDEQMGDKYLQVLNKVTRIIKRRKEMLNIRDIARRIPKFAMLTLNTHQE